jgi:hypothetical protein
MEVMVSYFLRLWRLWPLISCCVLFDMASLNCCGIFTGISYIYELIEATELWMWCMGSLQDQCAVQPSLYWVSGIPLILHLITSVKNLGKNFWKLLWSIVVNVSLCYSWWKSDTFRVTLIVTLPSECCGNFSYLVDMVIVSHGFSVASIQADGSIFD